MANFASKEGRGEEGDAKVRGVPLGGMPKTEDKKKCYRRTQKHMKGEGGMGAADQRRWWEQAAGDGRLMSKQQGKRSGLGVDHANVGHHGGGRRGKIRKKPGKTHRKPNKKTSHGGGKE